MLDKYMFVKIFCLLHLVMAWNVYSRVPWVRIENLDRWIRFFIKNNDIWY